MSGMSQNYLNMEQPKPHKPRSKLVDKPQEAPEKEAIPSDVFVTTFSPTGAVEIKKTQLYACMYVYIYMYVSVCLSVCRQVGRYV